MKAINWKRVWLAVMVGYVVLLVGGTLIGQHWAYQQTNPLPWEHIEVHYEGR